MKLGILQQLFLKVEFGNVNLASLAVDLLIAIQALVFDEFHQF